MADIQWFPGHMAKTKRLINENIKKVDLVIEVLDARAPGASGNPLLRKLTASKPSLAVLNKDDLADPAVTSLWMRKFDLEGKMMPLRISSKSGKGLDAIVQASRKLCIGQAWLSRRPVRALIVGIPNVGKSTIINAVSKKRKAEAGATAGLTRELRRIPVNSRFELFDTPGLLWHKFEDPLTGIILAALGSIKETILPAEELGGRILVYLIRMYPDILRNFYRFDEDLELPTYELMEALARRRGCIRSGGEVDLLRTSRMILKDLRQGSMGKLSLEWPDRRGWN